MNDLGYRYETFKIVDEWGESKPEPGKMVMLAGTCDVCGGFKKWVYMGDRKVCGKCFEAKEKVA